MLAILLTACSVSPETQVASTQNITVYKAPSWGCCGDWSKYLEDNGFTVTEIESGDLQKIKAEYKVPGELSSCHTAIVDGYAIEGHVPATEIIRLLTERPEVLGIAVAGMPVGSPGMEIEGLDTEPYDVVTFDKAGTIEVYASYP